jgi:hypothetical protein
MAQAFEFFTKAGLLSQHSQDAMVIIRPHVLKPEAISCGFDNNRVLTKAKVQHRILADLTTMIKQ